MASSLQMQVMCVCVRVCAPRHSAHYHSVLHSDHTASLKLLTTQSKKRKERAKLERDGQYEEYWWLLALFRCDNQRATMKSSVVATKEVSTDAALAPAVSELEGVFNWKKSIEGSKGFFLRKRCFHSSPSWLLDRVWLYTVQCSKLSRASANTKGVDPLLLRPICAFKKLHICAHFGIKWYQIYVCCKKKGKDLEFIPESELWQSYKKHSPSNATCIFNINLISPDWSDHPYSHHWTFNKKAPLPWSHAAIYCNINADKKDNTLSSCQSSHICACTWWKQRLPVGWRAEELQR